MGNEKYQNKYRWVITSAFSLAITAFILMGGLVFWATGQPTSYWQMLKKQFGGYVTGSPPSSFSTSTNIVPGKPTKSRHTQVIPGEYYPDIVEVKFIEGSGIRLKSNRFISLTGRDVSKLNRILDTYKLTIERMADRPEEVIEAENKKYQAAGIQISDPNLVYIIHLNPNQNTNAFVEQLNSLAIVEMADFVPVVINP